MTVDDHALITGRACCDKRHGQEIGQTVRVGVKGKAIVRHGIGG